LVEEVGIIPLPMCCFSFLGYICRRNVAYNGKKTMQLHVLPGLLKPTTLLDSFDLWMSRGSVYTFALVINYLNESWMPNMFMLGIQDSFK
jgi:hypothetical protein